MLTAAQQGLAEGAEDWAWRVDKALNMLTAGGGGEVAVIVAFWLSLFVFGAASYLFVSYTTLCIGRKAGLTENWMAFVPVARAIYRLSIVRERWWKMFMLADIPLYAGAVFGLAFLAFRGKLPFVPLAILVIVYVIVCFSYRLYYYYKYYDVFGLNPSLAMLVLVPVFGAFAVFFLDCLFAYSGLIEYIGPGAGSVTLVPRVGRGASPQGLGGAIAASAAHTAPPPASELTQALGGGTRITTKEGSPLAAEYEPNDGAPGEGADGPGGPGGAGGGVKKNSAPSQKAGAQGGGLTGVAGIFTGQTFRLSPGENILVGRDSSVAHIVFDPSEKKVSRKHMSIRFDDAAGCYYVTDLSTNGTYKGDGTKLVPNQSTRIERGETLWLGNRENQFRLL